MIAQAKQPNQQKLCDSHTGAQRTSSYIPSRFTTLLLITEVGVEKVGRQNVFSAANVPSGFFFPDL
jgi:hypothetical protein